MNGDAVKVVDVLLLRAGLPSYTELMKAVYDAHRWGETTGGWEANVWADLEALVRRLEAEQAPQ